MTKNKKEKSFYHRLFILFIILILPVFFIKEYRLIKAKKDTQVLPAEDFCQTHLQPQEDKSFTFIVLTQNNIDSIEQNFHSIHQQHYQRYHIIYIDQGSTDGTLDSIKSFMKQQEHLITLIECKKDYEVFQKYHEVVHNCLDAEVIIHLYGSDWLAHDDVLSSLNQSYTNPDVWLTYGQYLDYSSYKKGLYNPQPKRVRYKKRIQRAPWVVAPFKTYYASLFKKMLIEPGYFLSIESDNALLFPLAEMGKAHVRFIPDVLYIHNEKIPMGKRKHKLAFMAGKIAKSALTKNSQNLADLMIFSENHPDQLKTCLESSNTYLQGIHRIYVIYDCNEKSFAGYERLKQQFPHVNFIRPAYYARSDFKDSVLNVLLENSSSYVILTTDQVSLKQNISLSVCVEAMRKTRAYGFYFHLGKGEEETRGVGIVPDGVYMWNIRKNEGPWGEPDSLKMGLYRRLDLEKDLKNLSFSSTQSLISAWTCAYDSYRVGLSFEEPKIDLSLPQLSLRGSKNL